MGTWGTSLYSNDLSQDVRDAYIKLLEDQNSKDEAYIKIVEKFKEYLGDEEECLFWYALSDTQWKLGRLSPEVKEKAIFWIKKHGGIEVWENNKSRENSWLKTLDKLEIKLNSPMPEEKIIRKPKEFIRNPWSIGDVYAYMLKSEESKKLGLYGKYVVIQKVADEPYYNGYFSSVIKVFDIVFETIPIIEEVENVRILHLSNPNYYTKDSKIDATAPDIYTVVERYKINDFKKNEYFFVGNEKIQFDFQSFRSVTGRLSWKTLDELICIDFLDWQNFDYEFVGEKFVSKERKK